MPQSDTLLGRGVVVSARRDLWHADCPANGMGRVQYLHNAMVPVVRHDAVCRRCTTILGIGPVTALAFKTAIAGDAFAPEQPIMYSCSMPDGACVSRGKIRLDPS